MYMCTSKFEIGEEQRPVIKEYLTHEERQAEKEEKEPQAQNFEPISDNEEETQESTEVLSKKAQGKRRMSVASESENDEAQEMDDDDDIEVPLPDTQHRASGRVRKRSKLLDGYEVGRG